MTDNPDKVHPVVEAMARAIAEACGEPQAWVAHIEPAKAAAKVLIEECAKVATVVADRYPDKHDAYSMGARQAAEYIAGKTVALAKDMGLEPSARSEMGV